MTFYSYLKLACIFETNFTASLLEQSTVAAVSKTEEWWLPPVRWSREMGRLVKEQSTMAAVSKTKEWWLPPVRGRRETGMLVKEASAKSITYTIKKTSSHLRAYSIFSLTLSDPKQY